MVKFRCVHLYGLQCRDVFIDVIGNISGNVCWLRCWYILGCWFFFVHSVLCGHMVDNFDGDFECSLCNLRTRYLFAVGCVVLL